MDGLSVAILVVVAFISTLVQIYSLEYLRGDRRYTHFFAALTLFSGGMLGMVLAENMVQFILGWEIMGLCSFMLIGHWWEDYANSRAALKAFFTVRVGDVGLLVGVSVLYFSSNDWIREHLGQSGFSIQGLQAWALSGDGSKTAITWAAIALFIACIGKSGQFPLHTWLPDAMAGPTPVSSLLHSSTMVVAGVYLVARLYPVFFQGLKILDTNVNLIAVIGGITIIIAAALAFVQVDIKKVLAYSTVSQLGYMMMGLGVGAWGPAVFHIFTHAFFKAGLFLCAGSVSHSGSHHSFDMKKDMGGLYSKMKWTAWCWIIATAALCGIPFFAGFFSKDAIIDNAQHNGYRAFYLVGLIGVFMTAAYMTRATYLVFFGQPRGAAAGVHEEEHVEEIAEVHAAPELTSALIHAEEGAEAVDAPLVEDVSVGLTTERELVSVVAEDAGQGAFAPEAGHHDAHTADVLAHGAHDAHGAGGHDDHHAWTGPHESNWLIRGPIVLLAALSVLAGFLNTEAEPIKTEKFKEWVEAKPVAVPFDSLTLNSPSPEATAEEGASEGHAAGEAAAEGEGEHADEPARVGCGFDVPAGDAGCFQPNNEPVAHFEWVNALPSILLVLAGIGVALLVSQALYDERRARAKLRGITGRVKPLAWGYNFLWNKYYLDDLYEKVFVAGISGPIARAAYWINQNVIDGVVNGAGKGGKEVGRWVYRNIDQRVVDGAVNGSGAAAREAGGALRPVQSGKVNQYGALLFSAAAIAALVLVIVNT
jgi:NADH-quinone oxidoreductase subunit L